MAKLSAHGPAVLRLSWTVFTKDNHDSWYRRTVSYHGDGAKLAKVDFHNWTDGGGIHGTGWKFYGKVEASTTVGELLNAYTKAGWTVKLAPSDRTVPLRNGWKHDCKRHLRRVYAAS